MNAETLARVNYIKLNYAYELLSKADLLDNIIIKGAPLSKIIYGKEEARVSSDIDFLVPKNQIGITTVLMEKAGFMQQSSNRVDQLITMMLSHQTLPWIMKNDYFGNITVDLNYDLYWGEFTKKRIDVEEFISDYIIVDICGKAVKTLPPEKALIQLLLHHYKDMNSIFLLATRNSIRYDMLRDVYYLLINNLNAIPLNEFYSTSNKYEIIPYVFYVLYYTGKVFDDDVLRRYIDAFRTPEGEALLNCYGLCSKERKEWKFDFKTRLESENLYDLIKSDLTESDKGKIAINRRVFLGVKE